VGEFVSKQSLPLACARSIFPGVEGDMSTRRESAGSECACHIHGLRSVMDPHTTEVAREAVFHLSPGVRAHGLTAAQLEGRLNRDVVDGGIGIRFE
jgi:hypothetical protein